MKYANRRPGGRQFNFSSGEIQNKYSSFLPQHEAINVPFSKAQSPAAQQYKTVVVFRAAKSDESFGFHAEFRRIKANVSPNIAEVKRLEMDFLEGEYAVLV